MIRQIILSVVLLILMLSVIGCGNDGYQEVREAARSFLIEKGWYKDVKEESWQNAEVSEVTVSNSYHLLEEGYEGEEVLSVSFEGEEGLVVGVPVVILDPDTNEVVGYMPGE